MNGRAPFLYVLTFALTFASGLGLAGPQPCPAVDRAARCWTDLRFRATHLTSGGCIEAQLRHAGEGVENARRVVLPFDLGRWESGMIHLPLRVEGNDPANPAGVEVERILLDSPVGIDTISFSGPPFLFEGMTDRAGTTPAEHAVEGLVEPLWRPGDGDVLVISCDALSGALTPLLDDLSERGFRCARSRMSLILRDYGDEDAAAAIRDAVTDACRDFATRPLALILVGPASEDVPQNNLLPTLHAPYEHEFMGYYDATFAEDAAFGDLIVGRIPARTIAELSAYVAKLAGYRAQAPSPRVQFEVGDAAVNRDNSDRRRATEELLGMLQDGGVLQGSARYASSYAPVHVEANRVRALGDLLGDLAQGVGLLAVFGNNAGPTNIVHAWEAPPGPQQPWLRPSEMPTAGRLPIALFGTCLNGAFDEDAHFPGFDSPAETWVREPERGAIAVVAPSHLTTFFDDWEITGQLLRRLSRGDGTLIGAALAGTRESLLSEWTRGPRSLASVRMANLLGDPLLAPRLGIDCVRLAGSFELSGAWPRQNAVELDRGWSTNDRIVDATAARIVDGADGVLPVAGSRMMRVTARFREGAYRRAVAWRLFDCDLLVTPGAVLSAWLSQVDGTGRLGIDAVTASGLVMSECLLDERGIQADPRNYRSTRGRWNRVTIRLDRWAGERIRAVYVRYEQQGGGSGEPDEPGTARPMQDGSLPPETLLGFVDDVSIEPEEPAPFLDGAFQEDLNRDGRPDGWTAPWPASMRGEPACAAILLDDGNPSIVLSHEIESGSGLSQRIVVGPGQNRLQIGWDARSPDGGTMRVDLADPRTGELFDAAWIGPVGESWSGESADLALPPDRPVLFELRPSTGTLHVRALRVEEERPVEGLAEPPAPALSGWIEPNPTYGPIRIRWGQDGGQVRDIEVYDVSGRRVAVWQAEPRTGNLLLTRPDICGADGRPLAGGIYFVRIGTVRGGVTRRLHLIR